MITSIEILYIYTCITKDWDLINISYISTELKQINWMYLEQEYII